MGLAAARALIKEHPGTRLVILEKEPRLAMHQTGRNSGVIHSGIYYRPGSLKAKLCVRGARLLEDFCDAHRIPYRRCGKVIVAVDAKEVPVLDMLYERGVANGVGGIERIGRERLLELEPNVRGVRAIHLPRVAVVDFARVARALAHEIERSGGTILTGTELKGLREERNGWQLLTTGGAHHAERIINCGGLFVDRIGRMAGDRKAVHIVPFRGEYWSLPAERASVVGGLVYPVPDPSMPFLGVHFTKTLLGGVEVGPNAVLALKREGYRRADISWRDCRDLATSPGFWRMARRYWKTGAREMARSMSKQLFLREARRLVPSLSASDLLHGSSGVRAQAVDSNGDLLHDFVLTESRNAIHVYNAPSPAATASLGIGEFIASRVFSAIES